MYSPPSGTLAVTATTIASTPYNNFVNDLSSAITGSLPRDGSAGMLASLPMGGNKITGLAAASTNGDAVRYEQAILATNRSACSVIGRSANSSGAAADIAASTNDRLLARVSDTLSWVQITIEMIPNALITFAKLAAAAIASQADAEAGTSSTTLLTPQRGTQLVTKHQAAAKAWGSVNTSGNLNDHMNISGASGTPDSGTTITLDTDMGNANYAVVVGLEGAVGFYSVTSKTTGSFVVTTQNNSGSPAARAFSFVIFGD